MNSLPFLLLSTALSAPADDVAKATAELQGNWVLVLVEEKGGKPRPDDSPTTMTVKGTELSIQRGTAPPRQFTFAVDPTKTPPHLDLVRVGETGICHAIYRLEQGEMTICAATNLTSDEPGRRPQVFVTSRGPKDTPPKGSLMLTFKRAKK
jgi:uncharacterized protein (TIGR03067 family)